VGFNGDSTDLAKRRQDHSMQGILKCDVCGAPATNGEMEMENITPPDAGWAEFRPRKLNLGCDRHPAGGNRIEQMMAELIA
jgi:hypothetical protein